VSFVVLCKRDPQKILKKCFLGVENIPLGFCPPSLGLSLGRYFDEFGVGDEPVKNGAEKDGGKLKEKNFMVSSAFCSNGRDSVTDTHVHTHTHTHKSL
jgi:hypothetical protein